MHGKMKLRIVIVHRTKELIHANLRRQFLAYLPHECLLRRFPTLHLSARKLPPVLPLAIPPLRGENLIFFANYRCNDFYLFHCYAISFIRAKCITLPGIGSTIFQRICICIRFPKFLYLSYPCRYCCYIFDLQSRLLPLGIAQTSLVLLSLNRSLPSPLLRPTNDGGTTLLLTFISLASTYERPTNDGRTTSLRLSVFGFFRMNLLVFFYPFFHLGL